MKELFDAAPGGGGGEERAGGGVEALKLLPSGPGGRIEIALIGGERIVASAHRVPHSRFRPGAPGSGARANKKGLAFGSKESMNAHARGC